MSFTKRLFESSEEVQKEGTSEFLNGISQTGEVESDPNLMATQEAIFRIIARHSELGAVVETEANRKNLFRSIEIDEAKRQYLVQTNNAISDREDRRDALVRELQLLRKQVPDNYERRVLSELGQT